MVKKILTTIAIAIFLISCSKKDFESKTPLPGTIDKTDTLNVVAYNILNYGDGCQGSTSILDNYLDTIVLYLKPDLLSCEKMASFQPSADTPANFAALISNSMNAVFPDHYAYAIPTNESGGDMSVLFYNKQKLTYVKTELLVSFISDFDLYKLYYNDPNLSITKDTTYLYIAVNHTQSGSSSVSRDLQVTEEMQMLRNKFEYFPNLIIMGDFNTNNSSEAGYQAIISNADSTTEMSDPSFYPDKINHYPAYWTTTPYDFQPFLTTSTRQLSNVPNSCGTSGGAQSWFDHIFISPWLVKESDFISYIPDSYLTIGNDGNRLNVSINSNLPFVNNSAPAAVINALFQMSNKYPVSIKLSVKANRTSSSLADPEERN